VSLFLHELTGNRICLPNQIGGARDGKGGVVAEERAVAEPRRCRQRISADALGRG
jgi:hypothetical protein